MATLPTCRWGRSALARCVNPWLHPTGWCMVSTDRALRKKNQAIGENDLVIVMPVDFLYLQNCIDDAAAPPLAVVTPYGVAQCGDEDLGSSSDDGSADVDCPCAIAIIHECATTNLGPR